MPARPLFAGSERELVHRQFTIRWTRGCVHTRLYGQLFDDLGSRAQLSAWARALDEAAPELGDEFVGLVDVSRLGPIPRPLWLDFMDITRAQVRPPKRRAVVTAEGRIGDEHAKVAQLVTAGHVRAFQPAQLDDAIAWLGQTGIVDSVQLYGFLHR